MKISIITLFPKMIAGFFEESIVKRAQEKGLVEIEIINLRDFAKDKYKTVDDRPYGGGAGMVLMVEPLAQAIRNSKFDPATGGTKLKERVILTSPRGKIYNQKRAQSLMKLDHLILIAGHYEGVDERVIEYIDEEISIGDFVMTGGEIAAVAIVDSVVRLIPGVLKKETATEQESFFSTTIKQLIVVVGEHPVLHKLEKDGVKTVRLLEYPHYTRPENFSGKKVPSVLTRGNHAEIEAWRLKQAFEITLQRRPDLLANRN